MEEFSIVEVEEGFAIAAGNQAVITFKNLSSAIDFAQSIANKGIGPLRHWDAAAQSYKSSSASSIDSGLPKATTRRPT